MKAQTVNMVHHTMNVFSQIQESGTQNVTPIVGMPATINYYSDRVATTIVEATEKRIGVQNNDVKTIDYYAGQYEVLPTLHGGTRYFTKRKNGRWVAEGESLNKGLGISLGFHDHYEDPSF